MSDIPEGWAAERLGTITVGGEYRGTGGCIAEGWTYRVLRFARAFPVDRQIVVYEGVVGPDRGQWFACSPHDFASKLRPVQVDEPPRPADPPPPAKVAGAYTTGGGW